MATQVNAPWGLDRIDARAGLDNAFNYDYDGSNVDIYILDTSVQPHQDYNDRFLGCIDYTGEGCDVPSPDTHGTHVGRLKQRRCAGLVLACVLYSRLSVNKTYI